MLEVLTTDEFAAWFTKLPNDVAKDVADTLDVIERLGPEKAPPESHELLLWYEHESAARFREGLKGSIAFQLEAWGAFRDYVTKVLAKLESESFMSRVARLDEASGARVVDAIKRIKRTADPRARFALQHLKTTDARAEVRRAFFDALEAAGFSVTDVPAHSLALREISRRLPEPAFRILYGVHAERGVALVVVGEMLDRCFYGDSVRFAERTWKKFIAGDLEVRGDVR